MGSALHFQPARRGGLRRDDHLAARRGDRIPSVRDLVGSPAYDGLRGLVHCRAELLPAQSIADTRDRGLPPVGLGQSPQRQHPGEMAAEVGVGISVAHGVGALRREFGGRREVPARFEHVLGSQRA